MEEIGKIIHLSKSGRFIIKVNQWVKNGTFLFNSNGNKIAKVTEIIGSVKSPYVTALPLEKVGNESYDKRVLIKKSKGVTKFKKR